MKFFAVFSVIMMVLCAFAMVSEANSNCPQICTADYRPVCARKGNGTPKTFSNKCALEVHNCRKPQSEKLLVIKNSAC